MTRSPHSDSKRHTMTTYWRWPVLVLFTTVAFPADVDTQVTGPASPDQSNDRVAHFLGQRVYNGACAACHGVAGDGNGDAARYLNPRPRDFTSGTFKFRSTPDGELPTDDDLYRSVALGIPRTTMPAWKDLLTDQQIRDVVSYIKTFTDKFKTFDPGTPITIPDEPRVTSELLAEGRNMYIVMQCWKCHGVAGRGDGESADALVDDWKYRVKPFDFTTGNYKAGDDNRSVYKTFYTGLNGSPMPAYADAMLFGDIPDENLSVFAEAYSAGELEDLRAYLETQPDDEELEGMSEAGLAGLVGRRNWALVHYVKSLSRKKGLFYRLFVEDPELVKQQKQVSK